LRYKTGNNDFGIKTYAVNNFSQRKYNIYINGGLPSGVGVGDHMVIKGNNGRAIQITGGVAWKDQNWSYGCDGACFGGGSSVPIVFTNCVFTNQSAPPGATVSGLLGFTGLNMNELRVGPTIQNCTFAGGADDTFNVHGQWDETAKVSGTTLTYGYLGGNDINQGDVLRFYNTKLQLVDSATVTSTPSSASFTAPSNSVWHVFQSPNTISTWASVTVDHVVAAQYDYLINDATSSGAGAVFTGNHFSNNRSNGILIKSENDLIANNIFDGDSQAGVAAFPTLYWNEGGSTRNMVVTNNVFMNCGYWNRPDLANCGAMTIAIDGDPGGLSGPILTNILVQYNTFSNNAGINIVVKYGTDIRILNNLMEWTHQYNMDPGQSLGFDSGAEVWLGSCSNITLTANQVTHEGSYADGLVVTNSSAEDVTGLTGGVVLVTTPTTPTGLTAAPGNSQVILNWSASSGATSYNVKRSINSGGPYTTVASPTTTGYTDVGLTGGTTYYYVVSAVNVAGESANSGQVSATPTGNPAPVVWLRADGLEGVVNGGNVSTWSDSSGNGYNATQMVSNNQPTYVDNAMGGQPVVRFNSANSTYMSFTRPVSNDFTMTFVYQSTQGIGTGTAFFQGAGLVNGEVGGVENDFGTSLNANGQVLAGTGNPDTSINSGTGFNDGRPHVVTFKRTKSTGALALYVDGAQVSTGTGGTQSLTAPAVLVLGAQQVLNNYLSGDIAEVQIFNTALSDAQRQALESGLSSKYAVGLPSPWLSQDINASLPGGASYSTGVFTLVGSGADIYNTADQFRYAYQSGSGDCSVIAEVNSVSDTDVFAKGGVMIRETLNAGSMFALAYMRPDDQVQFVWRSSTGGSASSSSLVGGTGSPKWVEIVRSGNTFSAYYKVNAGDPWTQIGSSQTISMATGTQIGLAVTSHNTGSLCPAIFNNVTASP
jgi:hypothetical protein